MTLKRPEETFVQDATQLIELWRGLMGHGGFGLRSLWMIFLSSAGQLCPVVSPIDDIPDEPDDLLANVATVVAEVLAESAGTVAFLLSRPGPGQMTEQDRRWARALRKHLSPELSPWPVHLGTHDRVQVFAGDDLIG